MSTNSTARPPRAPAMPADRMNEEIGSAKDLAQ
jgi:hypothetical protein